MKRTDQHSDDVNEKAINGHPFKNKCLFIEVPLFFFGALRHIASSFFFGGHYWPTKPDSRREKYSIITH